jgi:hypothetical protein
MISVFGFEIFLLSTFSEWYAIPKRSAKLVTKSQNGEELAVSLMTDFEKMAESAKLGEFGGGGGETGRGTGGGRGWRRGAPWRQAKTWVTFFKPRYRTPKAKVSPLESKSAGT